ncbi:hypothetical protein A2U01_0079759, partial [Trifolium medium]|nr:hypothetical protein [Trifolium medium]
VALAKGASGEDAFLRGHGRNGLYFPCVSLWFPPRNLCEIRGGIFVGDNDDAIEKREVSLKRLEETDASSATATCAGYEEAQL